MHLNLSYCYYGEIVGVLVDWPCSTDGKKKSIQKGNNSVKDDCNNNLDFSQVVGEAGMWMDLVRTVSKGVCFNVYETSCSVIKGLLS